MNELIQTTAPSTPQEVQKAQALRLWDVVVLGPALIYASTRLRKPEGALRPFLLVSGALIMLYNGRNFLANRRKGIR